MTSRHALLCALTLPILLAASLAGADPVGILNDLRDGGCRGAAPTAPLTRSPQLDRVAEIFSQGTALGEALERSGYAATQAAGIQIESTALDDDAIFTMLAERFCGRVTDPQLRDFGFVQRADRLWLVVGEPSMTPASPSRSPARANASPPTPPALPPPTLHAEVPRDDQDVVADDRATDVIALINEARALPRRCGSKSYAAAPALRDSQQLGEASRSHAEDMAERGYFDHKTPEGVTPTQRLARTGYQWSLTGENIARGRMSAADAVAGWLASPGHCANIMEPRFSETGVALAEAEMTERGDRGAAFYWVQTFAAPRDIALN